MIRLNTLAPGQLSSLSEAIRYSEVMPGSKLISLGMQHFVSMAALHPCLEYKTEPPETVTTGDHEHVYWVSVSGSEGYAILASPFLSRTQPSLDIPLQP